ncbi:hypothetical protein [Vibrio breoganii]|nr:hypothetical protein [Vibrio breoganii]
MKTSGTLNVELQKRKIVRSKILLGWLPLGWQSSFHQDDELGYIRTS